MRNLLLWATTLTLLMFSPGLRNAAAQAKSKSTSPKKGAKKKTAKAKIDMRKVLIGRWVVDWEYAAKLTKNKRAAAGLKLAGSKGAGLVMTFKANGEITSHIFSVNNKQGKNKRRWRIVKIDGNVLEVENYKKLKVGKTKGKMTITVINKDLISYPTNSSAGIVMALRRDKRKMPAKPKSKKASAKKKPKKTSPKSQTSKRLGGKTLAQSKGALPAKLVAHFPPTPSGSGSNGAHNVAVSPDGKTVITGSYGGKSRIWDVARNAPRTGERGHYGDVTAVGFSHNGKLAYAADWRSVRVWQVSTGRQIGRIKHAVREDTRQPPVLGVKGQLATRDSMTALRVWDLKTVTPIIKPKQLSHEVHVFGLSPSGRWLTGFSGGRSYIWDIQLDKLALAPIVGDYPAISYDGKYVATGKGNTVELRELSTGRMVNRPLRHPSNGPMKSLFGRQGQLLAYAKSDAYLWVKPHVRSPRCVTLSIRDQLRGIQFLGDGKRIVLVGHSVIGVFRADTGGVLWRKSFRRGSRRTRMKASSNGAWILVHTRNREVQVYSAATGQLIARDNEAISGHVDGDMFVSGSQQGTKVWQLPRRGS